MQLVGKPEKRYYVQGMGQNGMGILKQLKDSELEFMYWINVVHVED